MFRHVRQVCGNPSLVRVAPGTNVFDGEVVTGSMTLLSRRDGTLTRALELSVQRPGFWNCESFGDF